MFIRKFYVNNVLSGIGGGGHEVEGIFYIRDLVFD
jgi:hypothetical protein